jgi:hypothetical protein
MANPVPYRLLPGVWNDDDVRYPISAARMSVLDAALLDVSVRPKVHSYVNATWSLPNATFTNVLMLAEAYNTHGMHSTGSTQYRTYITTPGVYSVNWSVYFPVAIATCTVISIVARVFNNGANSQFLGYAAEIAGTGSYTRLGGQQTQRLEYGDMLDFQAYQSSGAALSMNVNSTYATFLSAILVSF